MAVQKLVDSTLQSSERHRCRQETEDCAAWDYEDIQSVAGGFHVVGDKLIAFVSGRSHKMSHMSTGLLTLRVSSLPTEIAILCWPCAQVQTQTMFAAQRDGFASLQSRGGGGAAMATTRVITWDSSSLRHLFVNFAGEGLRVAVLDAGNVQYEYTAARCSPISGDSTRTMVRWGNTSRLEDLPVASGVRLRFEWQSGRLYSFWLAATPCGESRGYAAAGGPGLDGGRDYRGSCADE